VWRVAAQRVVGGVKTSKQRGQIHGGKMTFTTPLYSH
jgi:hypothetical protein